MDNKTGVKWESDAVVSHAGHEKKGGKRGAGGEGINSEKGLQLNYLLWLER